MLVSSHQELLIKISTLLSNNGTGNRCKMIKKGENPEQNIPIPKGFLSIFLANMLLERDIVYPQRPIFLLFYFNTHKEKPQNHKRNLKAFYLPLCSKHTNLKQKDLRE